MRYISTRGEAPALSFKEALLVGLADDDGLYVPETWPTFTPEEIRAFRGRPYTEVAFRVIRAFVGGEIDDEVLRGMIDDAYATFRHPAVVPLVQSGPNTWLMELFHGPTLAFKDVAMQILARLMDHVLAERGERLTIVGATSGDTGGAALEAFRHCEGIDTFFMYPDGKVSDVQRRQMTTVDGDNTHAIAIDGTFDDCQDMVKAMFAHRAFRDEVRLSAVNSINWGRVMAQTVYYFTAAASLGAPDRPVTFVVPTGNFGDIFAGYVASRMGLPVGRLVIATNENDILSRTLSTGSYTMADVRATITPSMDIQISSNFERLLHEAVGREPGTVAELLGRLKSDGGYALPAAAREHIAEHFDAGSADQAETRETIARLHAELGYVADPHTAVAVRVGQAFADGPDPVVILATAHPAKFPDTVEAATGEAPAVPARVAHREDAAEDINRLPNDRGAVEAFIGARSRVAKAAAEAAAGAARA